MFKVGDLVNIDGHNGTYEISGYAYPTTLDKWYHLKGHYNKNTVDGSFRQKSLSLVSLEAAYDPTQMGDKEDDI